MAGEWIKIRVNLQQHIAMCSICSATSLSPDQVVLKLYHVAAWFKTHGDYGNVCEHPDIVDAISETRGLSDALLSVGWLRHESGVLSLHWFTDVSSARKSLGRTLRRKLLSGAKCAACGATEQLVVDHIVPIARGGSSKEENLQALCSRCNRKKFKRTMEEFLRDS